MLAYELRTPLVGILGFSEILRDKIKTPELSEMADTILTSGKRLMETLNSVLDLSSIETDKLETNFTITNLVSFVDSNLKLFQPLAAKKGLSLTAKKTIKMFLLLLMNICYTRL